MDLASAAMGCGSIVKQVPTLARSQMEAIPSFGGARGIGIATFLPWDDPKLNQNETK
jgi:hypothetical protein